MIGAISISYQQTKLVDPPQWVKEIEQKIKKMPINEYVVYLGTEECKKYEEYCEKNNQNK